MIMTLHIHRQNGSNEPALEWIQPMVGPVGKWQCRCTFIVQDGNNDFAVKWIRPAVAEVRRSQDYTEKIITPMATPMWTRWGNDHDVAHLQAKTFPMSSIWSESVQWLLNYGTPRFQECFLRKWARPSDTDGQMTMTLHIYRRLFQRTWFGGYWVTVSPKFGLARGRNWRTDKRDYSTAPFFTSGLDLQKLILLSCAPSKTNAVELTWWAWIKYGNFGIIYSHVD